MSWISRLEASRDLRGAAVRTAVWFLIAALCVSAAFYLGVATAPPAPRPECVMGSPGYDPHATHCEHPLSLWDRTLGEMGFTKDDLKIFQSKIEDRINAAITERVEQIIPNAADGRPKELQNSLRTAHKALMARIERGLMIDVRYLPPTKAPADEVKAKEQADAVEKLKISAAGLVYPRYSGEPLLPLPKPDAANDESEPVDKAG